jgi:hypothetical protein
MRARHQTKHSSRRREPQNLTLGELIVRTYSARGKKRALNLLRLAMEANVIKFSRQQELGEMPVPI